MNTPRSSRRLNNPFRTRLFLLGIWIIILSVESPSLAKDFHSKTHGYSVKLPKGWVRIPNKVLKQFLSAAVQKGRREQVNWDAGFQADGDASWLTYPYVLIQVIPYSQFKLAGEPAEELFPEFVKAITGQDAAKSMDNFATDDFRNAVKQPQFGAATLDIAAKRYFWSIEMKVTGIGAVRGDIVGIFGRFGIVQVMFYDRKLRWKKSAAAREMLLTSIRLDDAYAHDPKYATVSKPMSPLKKVTIGAAIVGISAALIAAAIAVVRVCWRRASAEP